MEQWIDNFFDDPFAMSIMGMVLYFGIICWLETSTSKLTIKGWFNKNWFQLILGLLVCFIMVAKDDDIMHEFFNSGRVWPWSVYFCGGIILNVLYQVVALFPKIASYIVKRFNPIK